MSRWVIIGGAGLTGINLTKKLIKNINISPSDIVITDLKETLKNIQLPVRLLPCDISKNIFPKFKSNDIVIHLAARQYHYNVPFNNRLKWFEEVNVKGTENLLNEVINKKIKGLIFFSTDMVYGNPQTLPIKSNHPKLPLGPYGKSKLKAEKLCNDAQRNGLPLTILRPRLIMGPGRFGIMKKLFNTIALNRPLPLIGKGNNYYQMISVDDCSDAIILCAENNFPSKSLNLGSNPELKVKDLLKSLIKNVNSKSPIISLPATLSKFALNFLDTIGFTVLYPEQFKIADKNFVVDISETRTVINWQPKFSDIEMLTAAYKYWKTYQ